MLRAKSILSRGALLFALATSMAVVTAALISAMSGATRAPAAADTPPSPGVAYPVKLQSIAGNPKHLAVDPAGALWFPVIQPSGENTLYRYQPAADALTSWRLPSRPGGGWFVGLALDQAGRVWIAWDQTLVSFDSATGASRIVDVPVATAYEVRGTSGKWVRDLAVTGDGHVWLTRQHAGSLLEFDPAGRFTEHSLGTFGVGDRLRVSPDGNLWVTQARDPVTSMEFSKIAIFDPRTGRAAQVAEAASDIAFDSGGKAMLAGNTKGVLRLELSGQLAGSVAIAFQATASDVIAALPGSGFAVANRTKSTVIAATAPSGASRLFKLATTAQPVKGPPGYSGPRVADVPAEVTAIRADGRGAVWVAIPNHGAIARVQL